MTAAGPESFQLGISLFCTGFCTPVWVSYSPWICGLSQVWPSGSGKFFGKS